MSFLLLLNFPEIDILLARELDSQKNKMNSLKVSSIILLSLFSFVIMITRAQVPPTYRYHACDGTNFTSNSTYQINLNQLLSSLDSDATRSNINGFYNSTAGKSPDYVYGLFLCRGDFSDNVCQNCVGAATKEIVQRCPTQTIAIIWYDECFLRYSNRTIFNTLDESFAAYLWNSQNITNEPERFNQVVATTVNDTATRAASAPSGAKKFAVNRINFTGFQDVYSLAQCTPDISSSDCDRCLRDAIAYLPICCNRRMGGRVLFPSCNIRYEITEFYNATGAQEAAPPPPPAPPPIAPSPPPPVSDSGTRSKGVLIVIIVIPMAVSIAFFGLGFYFFSRRERKNTTTQAYEAGDEISTVESLQFDLDSIKAATNNFSVDNKLGEGGFGDVYKGTFPNGQQIAVKRLSKSSGQGAKEFKNEVLLVAKLAHRNLVRLLGFCLEREEKILVYEFVSNKSLDYFLFDPERQGILDWSRRYKIIGGIARGILYLHEDSRLKIIHRDLKASNILLDEDMNPKISDFGMARIFGVDQTQASTNRIVGTYGYMSPEYAMHGQFSIKSDIYSFGILLLEIISGKKNSSFYLTGNATDLASYVWKHWKDGTALEVLDPTLADTYSSNEVIRCIHIGLLCVQEDPADRPTMATIVLMLNSYSVTLSLPQEPAFFLRSGTGESIPSEEFFAHESKSKSVPSSVNEVSITEVYPR